MATRLACGCAPCSRRALQGHDATAGIGSVLLLPELLAKPTRAEAADELAKPGALLGRLYLLPVDRATAELAAALAAAYRLRAADAISPPPSLEGLTAFRPTTSRIS